MSWIRFALCGAAAGIINGLFGAGGGMVLVPMLICFGKLEDKKAFASSLSIILPLSVISLLTYATKTNLPLIDAAPYLLGGIAGGLLGSRVFYKLPVSLLHKVFGGLIIWGGVRLLL